MSSLGALAKNAGAMRPTRPSLAIFGWQIGVRKRTRGALNGVLNCSATVNMPPSYGDPVGPAMTASQQHEFLWAGTSKV